MFKNCTSVGVALLIWFQMLGLGVVFVSIVSGTMFNSPLMSISATSLVFNMALFSYIVLSKLERMHGGAGTNVDDKLVSKSHVSDALFGVLVIVATLFFVGIAYSVSVD